MPKNPEKSKKREPGPLHSMFLPSHWMDALWGRSSRTKKQSVKKRK